MFYYSAKQQHAAVAKSLPFSLMMLTNELPKVGTSGLLERYIHTYMVQLVA
jgi:hypothetical protein